MCHLQSLAWNQHKFGFQADVKIFWGETLDIIFQQKIDTDFSCKRVAHLEQPTVIWVHADERRFLEEKLGFNVFTKKLDPKFSFKKFAHRHEPQLAWCYFEFLKRENPTMFDDIWKDCSNQFVESTTASSLVLYLCRICLEWRTWSYQFNVHNDCFGYVRGE